ncbi:MAG: UDP-N-acetylmuramate--L-alanine ligase [Oscillospiraceae bacterium]|jgi:UDP-N-acetylmuramate--alanine ligase|nr:UDP-N-acetylmuramate--L-alanine ligase [Oscillospiraceae bacterium]
MTGVNSAIFDNVRRIHFIGVGGSGMCPLAEILQSEGFKISGSDLNSSDTLDRIIALGKIKVTIGHLPENVQGADLVVYSAAINAENPELKAAAEQGIRCIERSVMLGEVTRRYQTSVAVSGTHGKTSTTAMLAQILIGSGFDPSAIIGGKLPFIGGNSYVGQSNILVCEACEYVNTFLQLTPAISVILNVDLDHLDFFKDLDDIKKSFTEFANRTTQAIFVNGDDQNALDTVTQTKAQVITFGFGENNDYRADDISEDAGVNEKYNLYYKGELLTTIKLIVPGKHNIYNSLAAAATAHYLGADAKEISANLHRFGGVHRRFEILGKHNGITIADDFAHHPTELEVTLNAAMGMGFKRVVAIFQPHTFSRTALLLDDFARVLQIPDLAIVTEILPVRETNTYNIYSSDLVEKILGALGIDKFDDVADYIIKNAQEGDLILTMGGGNIYMLANQILNRLQEEE